MVFARVFNRLFTSPIKFKIKRMPFCIFFYFIFFIHSHSFAISELPIFSFGATLSSGYGSMGNEAEVKQRNILFTPLNAFAGFNVRKLRLGIQYEYYMANQLDDPELFNSQNLSGKGSSIGARLDYYNGKHCLGIIYRFSDEFTLSKPTVSEETAIYKGYQGFELQYYQQLIKNLGFAIGVAQQIYDESTTKPIQWNRLSIGLIYTHFSD